MSSQTQHHHSVVQAAASTLKSSRKSKDKKQSKTKGSKDNKARGSNKSRRKKDKLQASQDLSDSAPSTPVKHQKSTTTNSEDQSPRKNDSDSGNSARPSSLEDRGRRYSEPLLNSWEMTLYYREGESSSEDHNSQTGSYDASSSNTTSISELEEKGDEVLAAVLQQKKATSQIRFKDKDERVISLATVDCLVGRLADHNYQDKKYNQTFLLTHEYFVDAVTFLKMLINHYRAPKFQEDGVVDDKSRTFIQLRVINVLKKWIEMKYWEVRKNREWVDLLSKFLKFLATKGTEAEKKWSIHLKKYLREHSEFLRKLITVPSNPLTEDGKKRIDILELNPEILASQLTLIDHNMFKSVKLSTYFHKNWESKINKKDQGKNSSSSKDSKILKIVERFNEVSYWVATEIILAVGRKQRASKIAKFINLMDLLRQKQNFHGVMQIYSALNLGAITRLKKSWKDVPSKVTNTFNSIAKFFLQEQNFRCYRDTLEQINPPAVPYQGLILSDLMFIEEMNDFITDVHKFVNWEKMTMLSKVFSDILKFQRCSYDIAPVPSLISYLSNLSDNCYIATEEELHKGSLFAEREEGEGKEDPPNADDSEIIRTMSKNMKKKTSKKTKKKELKNPTFDILWTNQTLFNNFQSYLESIYNVENLLFYKDAMEYRKIQSDNKEVLGQQSQHIYDTYISDDTGSPLQVSLTLDIKREIEEKVAKQQITKEIFLDAEMEIEFLLKTSFSQFVHKRTNK